MQNLLPMDRACLAYLAEHGPAPVEAIPARLFVGEIPAGYPNLIDLGFVEHIGGNNAITAAGRAAITSQERNP